MNCPNCGNALPEGTQICPACGMPQDNTQGGTGYPQGYHPAGYTGGKPQGYAQNPYAQGGYPQGYDPAAAGQGGFPQGQNGFPAGYQQVYNRYSATPVQNSEFLAALANLPRVIRNLFSDPGETLHGMMERKDRYTGAVVASLSLLLTFLVAILVTRGVILAAFTSLSGLTGVSLAADEASLNQGVNYIAGKMAVSVGGIAALCQLLALLLPAAVTLTYLCAVKKVRFSFLLTSNLVAIVTLPSIAAAVLCMLCSLLSPVLAVMMLVLGDVVSYVLLCALIVWITGLPQHQVVPVKIAIVCSAEALKILFIWLVGGALATGALHTVSALVGSMGSLL
ncbi:MAG: zinc ribbon domain-containing protein [Eubacteriales bacterium]|nr:zinc ribbon domain-containing protein [Eubacteriales bacterium]